MVASVPAKTVSVVIVVSCLMGCSGTDTVDPGPDIAAPFASVSVGLVHTCGLTEDGEAYCWGWGLHGQLGNGAAGDVAFPVAVSGGHVFQSLQAGGGHTCGIDVSGDTYCWGLNLSGQLGSETSSDDVMAPIAVPGGLAFVEVTTGATTTCGLTADGTAYCWGYNEFGQLGDGTTTDRSTPTAVSGGFSFATISAGSFHTCAITATGDVYCWGQNEYGQLGGQVEAGTPQLVDGGLTFASISAGFTHTCGVTTDGDTYCWGDNTFGQVGDSTRSTRREPTPVEDGTDFLDVSVGGNYSCGLRGSGEVWCWGYNGSGQLGTAAPTECGVQGDELETVEYSPCALTPIHGADGFHWAQVSSNTQHACGLTTDHIIYCWGAGESGQLGNGESGSRYYSVDPVLVARQP